MNEWLIIHLLFFSFLFFLFLCNISRLNRITKRLLIFFKLNMSSCRCDMKIAKRFILIKMKYDIIYTPYIYTFTLKRRKSQAIHHIFILILFSYLNATRAEKEIRFNRAIHWYTIVYIIIQPYTKHTLYISIIWTLYLYMNEAYAEWTYYTFYIFGVTHFLFLDSFYEAFARPRYIRIYTHQNSVYVMYMHNSIVYQVPASNNYVSHVHTNIILYTKFIKH